MGEYVPLMESDLHFFPPLESISPNSIRDISKTKSPPIYTLSSLGKGQWRAVEGRWEGKIKKNQTKKNLRAAKTEKIKGPTTITALILPQKPVSLARCQGRNQKIQNG